MKKLNVMEIKPVDGRKSFYGKAEAYTVGNRHVLRSYDTFVGEINSKGEFLRYWDGESATTMRHIRAFLDAFGVNGGSIAWWRSLPVKKFDYYKFAF